METRSFQDWPGTDEEEDEPAGRVLRVTEPIAVADVFATDLLPLEFLPGHVRLTLAATGRPHPGAEPELQVTVRIRMTREDGLRILWRLARAYLFGEGSTRH